jgi:hypothetical protein
MCSGGRYARIKGRTSNIHVHATTPGRLRMSRLQGGEMVGLHLRCVQHSRLGREDTASTLASVDRMPQPSDLYANASVSVSVSEPMQ